MGGTAPKGQTDGKNGWLWSGPAAIAELDPTRECPYAREQQWRRSGPVRGLRRVRTVRNGADTDIAGETASGLAWASDQATPNDRSRELIVSILASVGS